MAGPVRLPSSSNEPAIRRLGVRSSAHIERPIRAQAAIGGFVALLLIAIPLYLLRRPSAPDEARPQLAPEGFSPVVAVPSASEGHERVVLGDAQRVRCSSAPGVVGSEGVACDRLEYFEKALRTAIVETVDCAPRTNDEGSLNYVLKIDFNQKTLHVFPGASGTWKGPQARRAATCVKQGLSAPDWTKIEHKFRYYELAVLATYRVPPSTVPLFE